MKMDLSEKLSALILASEVIKNVGIHADHDTRQKVSNELMERLSGALAEMEGASVDNAPVEKPKRGRKSEQSKKPVTATTDNQVEEKETQAVTEQAVKASAEPEPTAEEPTAEEPTAEEPTAEEPTAEEPTAEEPTAEEPTAEEPVVQLSYDKDVAPAVRAAAAVNRGRAVDLLKAYGATRANEVKEEDWPALINQMNDIANGVV